MAEKKEGGLSKFKQKKRKVNIIKVAILIVAVILLFYFTKSIVNIISLSNEKADVDAKNKELTKKVEDLNQELENVNSDEYIEFLARRNLKLVKKKEKLYILPSFESDEKEEAVGEITTEEDTEIKNEDKEEIVDGEGKVEKDE